MLRRTFLLEEHYSYFVTLDLANLSDKIYPQLDAENMCTKQTIVIAVFRDRDLRIANMTSRCYGHPINLLLFNIRPSLCCVSTSAQYVGPNLTFVAYFLLFSPTADVADKHTVVLWGSAPSSLQKLIRDFTIKNSYVPLNYLVRFHFHDVIKIFSQDSSYCPHMAYIIHIRPLYVQ